MRKKCRKGQRFVNTVYSTDYQISNFGRVWSKKKKIFLQELHLPNGYVQVALYVNGKDKRFYVHQLIVDAFIRVYDRKREEAHHMNHKRTDNRLDNLQIITKQKHRQDPVTRAKISEAKKGVPLSEEHKKHISETLKRIKSKQNGAAQ